MTEIFYATSNQMKFDEASQFFTKHMPHIILKQLNHDFEEIQTLDQRAIALHKAKQAWNYLKKPVLAEDAGIYFDSYNEFPGTLTKFVFNGIGYEGIFKLVGHDEGATFKLTLVFMYGDNRYLSFEGSISGTIIHTQKTDRLYSCAPFDPIFVPVGQQKTYSQLRYEGLLESYNYRMMALERYKEWLIEHTHLLEAACSELCV